MFEVAKLALGQLKPKVPKDNTQTNKRQPQTSNQTIEKKGMFETTKLALDQLKPKVPTSTNQKSTNAQTTSANKHKSTTNQPTKSYLNS